MLSSSKSSSTKHATRSSTAARALVPASPSPFLPGLFEPPPPLNALPRGVAELFLARPVLVALKMALVSATLACFMPRWLRFMLPVVCVLATLQECIVRGFGHMNHAEIPMLFAVYVLAIASWQRDRQWNPEPLTIAIIVVATYVLTGMRRVMAGGLDVKDSPVNGTSATVFRLTDCP